MFFIYKITNIINNKIYIGKSKTNRSRGRNRFSEHINDAKNGSTSLISRAIRKYGVKNFEAEIIEGFEIEPDAYLAETKWINFYESDKKNIGYNLTKGGEGVVGPSDELRKKLSLAHKGQIVSKKTRIKLSLARSGDKNPNFGKPMSEEQKQKISKARLGIIPSEETRKKISKHHKGKNNPFFGKKHTPETKQKMSEKKLGRKLTPEHKAKLSSNSARPSAKLNENQVKALREEYKTTEISCKKLANKHNISESTLKKILSKKTWKHI